MKASAATLVQLIHIIPPGHAFILTNNDNNSSNHNNTIKISTVEST